MSRNRITVDDERKILRLWKEGKTQSEIMRAMGRSRDPIYDALVRLGLNEDGLRTECAAKLRTQYEKKRAEDPALPDWHSVPIEIRQEKFEQMYAEMKKVADLYRKSVDHDFITVDNILGDLDEIREQAKNLYANIDRVVALIRGNKDL